MHLDLTYGLRLSVVEPARRTIWRTEDELNRSRIQKRTGGCRIVVAVGKCVVAITIKSILL